MDGSCNIFVVVFLWLLTLSNVDLCICRTSYEVQCLPSERDALLKMKSHLSDPSNRLTSWSLHANCCSWVSVVCHNITGHVLELHLTTPPPLQFGSDDLYETLMFGGEVHSSLLDLKHLNYLDLSSNNFGGMQIPGFLGSMTSLTYLNLSNARFAGSIPLQFWNLSNLIYLDLGGNYLEGSIPHQIGNLSKLICLNLSSNVLEGSIPHQIGKLSNLQYLGLGGNEFNGSIPCQIGKLSNLQYLDLGGSESSLSIPRQIGNLSNLQYLDLGCNQFGGSIPHQIGNLSNLINLISDMMKTFNGFQLFLLFSILS
ncbi:receptor-like protein 53 [Neltuma alba]|uniref:receptor-like protein 53 n=1 Tax=Neltuma alba TaxID=207710 RepID=UPI0010A31E1D|nr:receptor-like protein 53 [Prosopis alba]